MQWTQDEVIRSSEWSPVLFHGIDETVEVAMREELRSIGRYYMALLWRVLQECVRSAKVEVRGNVAIAIISYLFTFHDKGAWESAKIAFLANLVWLGLFVGWHLIRTPSLLQREGLPADVRRQASVLADLPVYAQDLRVELLALCHGTTLDFSHATLFLKLSLLSESDVGIMDMNVSFIIQGTKYSGQPLTDLSEWILRSPVKQAPQYPYQKTTDEDCLEQHSLWKDVQQKGIRAAIPSRGWIGIKVADATPMLLGQVGKVRVNVVKTQRREPYRFTFDAWEQTDEIIFDREFRQT